MSEEGLNVYIQRCLLLDKDGNWEGGLRKRDNCHEEVFVCVEISVLQSS